MLQKTITAMILASFLTACTSNATENETLQRDNQERNQTSQEDGLDYNEASSLPEFNYINEQIDNTDYNFKTITDNKDKRILLLTDTNGVKHYKTVFIKPTKRLKIINLNEEEKTIYNDIIS